MYRLPQLSHQEFIVESFIAMTSLFGCPVLGSSGERWLTIAYFLIIGSDAPAALSIDAIVSPVLAPPRTFSVPSALIDPL